ncbi:MAG TPA: type II CAAX endopeptidase family protein [Candidatus Binataceae bacterium]
MRSLTRRVAKVIYAAILAVFIGLFGQGIWSALIVGNLRTTPGVPWAVVVMAPIIWTIWLYLGGSWWPRSNSETRRRLLRANAVSRNEFAWALIAGALSIVALSGYWIVVSQIVRLPSNVLPDMSQFPLLTTTLLIAMGSVLGPLLEQAGFWGYCQVMLEQDFPGAIAIVITAVLFAMLPHPPAHAVLWPKLSFYFMTGAMFGVIAYFTNSILPGIVVHILGDLTFFTMVWPHDSTRRLIGEGGADVSFWIHGAQAIVFTALALVAFSRLAKVTRGARAARSSHIIPGSIYEPAG